VNSVLEALFADGSRVGIGVPRIEVTLIDSLVTPHAVHILKVVHLLLLVANFFILDLTQNVAVADAIDLSLALRAGVFHISDPLLNARVAVLVRALV